MRKSIFAFLLTMSITAAAPGQAQSATAPPVDPARLAAARDVITATHADQMMAGSVGQMTDPMFDAMRKEMLGRPAGGDPNYGERVRRTTTVIKSEMAAMMTEMQPQLIDMIVNLYARNYTVDEMHAISAFYRSPAGQSFIRKTPMVMRDLGQSLATTMIPQMTRRMEAVKAKVAAAVADLPPPPKAAN